MSHTPGPRRSAHEQAKLDAALADLFERRITFNQTLGLKVLSARHGDVRVRFDMRPELVGHYAYGRLHGGVTAAVLDALGGLTAMVAVGEKHCDESAEQVQQRFARLGTIDLRTDFLRPGLGQYFLGSSELTRLGGRVCSTLMRLTDQDGMLLATAAGAYMVS